jgi:urea transport system permease protein
MPLHIPHRPWISCACAILIAALSPVARAGADGGADPAELAARQALVRAVIEPERAAKLRAIQGLAATPHPILKELLAQWREDAIFLVPPPEGSTEPATPVVLVGEPDAAGLRAAVVVATGAPLVAGPGATSVRLDPQTLQAAEHTGQLRSAMKAVNDLLAIADPDPARRLRVVEDIGQTQDAAKRDLLAARLPLETDRRVRAMLERSIALIDLKHPDPARRVAALELFRTTTPMAVTDFVRAAGEAPDATPEVREAARLAAASIEDHRAVTDFLGTLFRGLSLGSVLLLAAIGLAITFGLMGVINMAHGEMIAVGAYTTYVVQNVFGGGLALSPLGVSIALPGMHLSGRWYDSYFLWALPCSFLAAALVGIGLERSVIRFLYRRPLESLLATWGASLVFQQMFRLLFGANNVQVSSPAYLSGNWTVNEIIFGWNRLFVIAFAVLVVFGTHLILTRTSLGLLMRSVMQNRQMAACMGVRTERVNMLTFGLGSGLAGLAGAFLSQIGNVGPSLGQSYIIDAFMTVVVGGVGSLVGTVISALGIGMVDQGLQQALRNPVLGKILVLGAIILFLQWRPAGLFATRGRGLED